eukprot:gene1456-32832_t
MSGLGGTKEQQQPLEVGEGLQASSEHSGVDRSCTTLQEDAASTDLGEGRKKLQLDGQLVHGGEEASEDQPGGGSQSTSDDDADFVFPAAGIAAAPPAAPPAALPGAVAKALPSREEVWASLLAFNKVEGPTLSKAEILETMQTFKAKGHEQGIPTYLRLADNLAKVPGWQVLPEDSQLGELEWQELILLLDVVKRDACLSVLGQSTYPGTLLGCIQREQYNMGLDLNMVGCTALKLVDLEEGKAGLGREVSTGLLHVLKALQAPGLGTCPWKPDHYLPHNADVDSNIMACFQFFAMMGIIPNKAAGRATLMHFYANHMFELLGEGEGGLAAPPEMEARIAAMSAANAVVATHRIEAASGGRWKLTDVKLAWSLEEAASTPVTRSEILQIIVGCWPPPAVTPPDRAVGAGKQ